MRRTVVGVVAVVAAIGVTLTALGMAEAASMLRSNQADAVAEFSPSAEAATLQTLHDSLESQWHARDVPAIRTTQSSLSGELAKLKKQGAKGKAALTPNTVTATDLAVVRNDRLGQELAALADTRGPAANAAAAGADSLASAIQALLAAIFSLVNDLLKGLPVSISLPVPTTTTTTASSSAAPPAG